MDDDTPLRGTGPRLITPAEFAAVLKVTEQDVLDWIAEGRLPSEPGSDGAPCVRIIDEAHEDRGATRASSVMYSSGSLTREEIRTRRRERERESYGYDGPIDVNALTEALASRLAAVLPRSARRDRGRGDASTERTLRCAWRPARPTRPRSSSAPPWSG